MVRLQKAVEIHERYSPLDYPVDAEAIARKEGLEITFWPLLSPVQEIKVDQYIGLREGLSKDRCPLAYCPCFGPSSIPKELIEMGSLCNEAYPGNSSK